MQSRNPTLQQHTQQRQGCKSAHPSATTTEYSRRITQLTLSTRDPRMRRPAATVSPVPASATNCDLRTALSRHTARSSAHSHVLSPPSYAPRTRSAAHQRMQQSAHRQVGPGPGAGSVCRRGLVEPNYILPRTH